MSVPDLKGSQGTYYYFSSDRCEEDEGGLAASMTSGERIRLEVSGAVGRASIPGPENSLREGGGPLEISLEIHVKDQDAELSIDGARYPITRREYTPWIELGFKAAPGITVSGIVRFYLLETSPHVKLYMTPINIDPNKPALPISHPFTYALYLSKTQGRYATLGLAEDTSALNEDVVDEDAFLKLTYLIHAERERMFFDALDKTNRGRGRVFVRYHGPSPAHVLSAPRRRPPGQPGSRHHNASGCHSKAISGHGRSGGPDDRPNG